MKKLWGWVYCEVVPACMDTVEGKRYVGEIEIEGERMPFGECLKAVRKKLKNDRLVIRWVTPDTIFPQYEVEVDENVDRYVTGLVATYLENSKHSAGHRENFEGVIFLMREA